MSSVALGRRGAERGVCGTVKIMEGIHRMLMARRRSLKPYAQHRIGSNCWCGDDEHKVRGCHMKRHGLRVASNWSNTSWQPGQGGARRGRML